MANEPVFLPTPEETEDDLGGWGGVGAGGSPGSTAQQQRLMTLGTLSAVVAHELRQPLTALNLSVGSLAQWLDADVGALDRRALDLALGRIKSAVDRMTVLVDHLQTDADARTSRPAPVNLDEVVWGALQFVGDTLRRQGIEIQVETGHPPPVVLAEQVGLEHLVLNLLCNAREALKSRPGARVAVRTWADDGHGVIEVSDNGPGVPEEIQRRVFEPFVTTRSPGAGTGLGLAISREIARRHLGDLVLVPGDLGGGCFRARLPLATGPLNQTGE